MINSKSKKFVAINLIQITSVLNKVILTIELGDEL